MDMSVWDELRERLSFSALGKPALIGIAALFVMVAVFAGKYIVDAATASEITVERPDARSSEGAPPEEVPQTVYVHVSGAVAKPGLVELEAGSRVAQAIEAAGGFADGAAADSVNLARTLEDGEQVYVSAAVADAGAPVVRDEAATAAQGGKVNLNTASAAELQELPGIGEATSRKIVSDRDANGRFASVDELTRVSGIGDKKLEAIRDLVCV